MSRLMSVTLTEQAVVERRKTVTRRLGWWADRNGRRLLVPGDTLTLCRKVMGRKKGDPLVRLAEVEVVDMCRQQLCVQNTPNEAEFEGFPEMRWPEFVEFFCREMRCEPTTPVTRIQWRYLDEDSICEDCGREAVCDPYSAQEGRELALCADCCPECREGA